MTTLIFLANNGSGGYDANKDHDCSVTGSYTVIPNANMATVYKEKMKERTGFLGRKYQENVDVKEIVFFPKSIEICGPDARYEGASIGRTAYHVEFEEYAQLVTKHQGQGAIDLRPVQKANAAAAMAKPMPKIA